MGFPVVNLGQRTFDIPYYRKLLREACGNWDFYQNLAQTDPDYQDTADWYSDLCYERQAALTRAIRTIAEQETPLSLQGIPLSPGLGTRVFSR